VKFANKVTAETQGGYSVKKTGIIIHVSGIQVGQKLPIEKPRTVKTGGGFLFLVVRNRELSIVS